MGKSERSPDLDDEPQSPLAEALATVGGVLVRNPALVGGTTAFIVALSYVSANAIWYQPHFHSGAFFATRTDREYQGPTDPGLQETTIKIERESDAAAVQPPKPDPAVERVQAALQSMNLYEGQVDGVSGPNTRRAIESYRRTMGLPVTGDIDDRLLEMLGGGETTAGIPPTVPVPSDPAPRLDEISARIDAATNTAVVTPAAAVRPASDPRIAKIQAGLKAFGNDKIEVDGLIGSKTRAAIKEFQSLFGLPATGEPDQAVYAKMREIGLTD